MRFPAYVFLPLLGVVVLVAAVLGTWLWPAPTGPSDSAVSSVRAMPVATETPSPSPAPLPPPVRAASRPVAAPPIPAQVPPPTPAPMPTEPMAEASPPPVPPNSQITNLSPEAREGIKKNWSSLRNRAAELALRGMEQLERQRDEARARGDQAEFERLDAMIRTHKERVELMRGVKPEVPSANPVPPPPAQAGPPVQ